MNIFMCITVALVQGFTNPASFVRTISNKNVDTISYTDLVSEVKQNSLSGASIVYDRVNDFYAVVSYDDAQHVHQTRILPSMVEHIVNKFSSYNIPIDILQLPHPPNPLQIVFYAATFYLLFSIASNRYNQQLNPPMFSNKQSIEPQITSTKFSDVVGCEETKTELLEIIDFLKNPQQYNDAGAKLPNGVLLEGPPGTGKTLLARAVAGEAQVPFFSASASEFVEVYVGVGAQRVRQLFDVAKENSPCVIFIDEIDAIGKSRVSGNSLGSNDEREQTLNQILTSMDGFDNQADVVVLAATNRAEILDPALVRPGRFDRKIQIPLPNTQSRRDILDLYLTNKTIDNLCLDEIVSLTQGFSGADLANLVNEATLLSVRRKSTVIHHNDFIDAFEKIKIGIPYKNDFRSFHVLERVARHEIGHAFLAQYFKKFFDIKKITIKPNQRGSGGYVLFTTKEPYDSLPTKEYLLAQIVVALGGRAAEIIFYNNSSEYQNIFNTVDELSLSTGSSADLQMAYNLANAFVSKFGFSTKLVYDPSEYMNDEIYTTKENDIENVVQYCFTIALDVLRQNKLLCDKLALNLIHTKEYNVSRFLRDAST